MNIANKLTVLRIILSIIAPLLLFYNSLTARITAGILLTIAGLTDLYDGWLARKLNIVTTFGKILDPIADKILVLGTFAIFIMLGIYPLWIIILIILIAIRELLVITFRVLWMLKGSIITPAKSGKLKTFTQLIALLFSYSFFMSNIYLQQQAILINISLYGAYILIIISSALAVYSGIYYAVENRKLFFS